jgi:DNA-binding transcriptional regulator YiaG
MVDQPHFEPEAIAEARRRLRLTQAQLAHVLGCSLAHVKAMEAVTDRPGRRRIDPAYARLLVAYLDGYRPADWPA